MQVLHLLMVCLPKCLTYLHLVIKNNLHQMSKVDDITSIKISYRSLQSFGVVGHWTQFLYAMPLCMCVRKANFEAIRDYLSDKMSHLDAKSPNVYEMFSETLILAKNLFEPTVERH